ncbi:unnamed protein product [Dovyalis caffra]|uniref:Uncharacterized protein n=1 Tax=Dovyalis caffra TaxID=77055 RepID=A0AAV1RVG3_9ROSI|nr:unnamed protein product [Dovyalis caffra]
MQQEDISNQKLQQEAGQQLLEAKRFTQFAAKPVQPFIQSEQQCEEQFQQPKGHEMKVKAVQRDAGRPEEKVQQIETENQHEQEHNIKDTLDRDEKIVQINHIDFLLPPKFGDSVIEKGVLLSSLFSLMAKGN